MNIDFLTPIEEDITVNSGLNTVSSIGDNIQVYTRQNGFPDLDGVSIAVLGVKEGRRSVNNDGCGEDLSNIRREFYKLFPGNWHAKIVDVGNVIQGNSVEDTYYAVAEISASLLKLDIIPVVIGGGQDITYASYRAYDQLEQTVNLVTVDSRFNIGSIDEKLTSTSFLSKIIMESPNNLFNYSNIGYQTYYNSQEEISLLNNLYFDAFRLGEARDVRLIEPIMRDADVVSIDIGAVKQSDAKANKNASPNGFYGDEICAIARYAGISDKVTSFGIYEYNSRLDSRNSTASLIAQMIWYFIEGFNVRAKDYPYSTKESYQKFMVLLDDDDPINFYKSDKSGRWWMEINLITDNKYKRHALIPCAYQDYVKALEQEIPERWYKAQQKLT